MKPATITPARAHTANSKARETQIKTDNAKAQARRNYKPPQSATKKLAQQTAQQAAKVTAVELDREQDQALYQAQILAYYRSRADAFETDR